MQTAPVDFHPHVKEFADFVRENVGANVLRFSDIQSPPFQKFWRNFLILEDISGTESVETQIRYWEWLCENAPIGLESWRLLWRSG